MKKIFMLILGLAMLLGSFNLASAAVHVRGYYKSNGTYVAPHYRSDPDGSAWNNWSTSGNINPYTGKRGTRRMW